MSGPELLSRKQRESIGQSTARINIWEGSVRSGKTVASLWRWLMFVATAPRGGELVMFGKTRDSVASNLFEPLTDPALFGECSRDVHYTPGAPFARIYGRRVRVVGANDAKAEPKVRGGTWVGAYGDELTTLPEAFFRQALARLSPAGAKLFGTTNPDTPAHWLRRDFLHDDTLDLRSWHFTIDDNPFLSAEYVTAIKAEYKGLWYRRFIQGQWVAAEGAIYDMFDEARHVLRGPLPTLVSLPAAGVDYGTTNPFAAVLLGAQPGDVRRGSPGRLVLAREYRHDPRQARVQLTDADYSRRLLGWLGTDQPQWVAVDPSAASFKVQLFRDGLSNMVDADNAVLDGIRLLSSLLAADRLVVHESCRGLLEEIPGYSWDDRATELGQDVPVKVEDHSLDAARYAIKTTEPAWRPVVDVPVRAA